MKSQFFIVIAFVFVSCQSPTGKVNSSVYCDIAKFVDSEIVRMDSLNPPLLRYSEWNGVKSTDTAYEVDWTKELALFSDLHIPLSVWKTDFERIDSISDNHQTIRTYGALIPQQEVRLFRLVTNDKNELHRLEVELRSISNLSKSTRKMSYTKDKGYTIAGHRKTRILKDENYKIVCQLIANDHGSDSHK